MSTLAEEVATLVLERLPDAAWLAKGPIISRDEAMQYARIRSRSAWYEFTKRNELTALPCGNYARDRVERAAAREARKKAA